MKLFQYIKIIIMFYKSISLKKISFMRKKIHKANPMFIHLIIQISKLIITFVFVFLLHRSLYKLNLGLYIFSLLLFYLIQHSTILFDSFDKIKKNYKYNYLRLSSINDNQFIRKILIINYWVNFISMLPFILPISISLIFTKGLSVIPTLILIKAVIFFLYCLMKAKKVTKNNFISTLFVIISRGTLCIISYCFMLILVQLMLLSRTGIKNYGISIEYVLWTNKQINNLFTNLLNIGETRSNLFKIFNKNSSIFNLLIFISIFILFTLSIFFLKQIKANKRIKTFQLPPWYLSNIKNKINKVPIDNAYKYKDICMLYNRAKKIPINPISFFITGEMSIIFGLDIVLLPHIHNSYILLFIFFIELFTIITGSLRTLNYWFSDIFKFESDCKNWKILYFSDFINTSHVLSSKYSLLQIVAFLPSVTTSAVLFMLFAFYMKWACFLLFIDFVLIIGLYKIIIKWVLRTDYDVFCLIVKNGISMKDMSINDHVGYNLLLTANRSPNRIVMYITIFCSLLCAFFILIHGLQWLIFYTIYIIVFACTMFVNSKYYSESIN